MEARRIARLLPEVYQAAHRPGSVLDAALAAMEALHAPAEAALETLDARFDPRRAPEPFLRMLAGWLALGDLLEAEGAAEDGRARPRLDPVNLRELVLRAAELARLRGTAGALRVFLEIATGVEGFEVREAPTGPDGGPRSFAAEVLAPAAARPFAALVALVVAREKPAFTTVTVSWRDA